MDTGKLVFENKFLALDICSQFFLSLRIMMELLLIFSLIPSIFGTMNGVPILSTYNCADILEFVYFFI